MPHKYTTFDIVKVESMAMAEANALFNDQKAQRVIITKLIQEMQWENSRIVELFRFPVDFVETVRLELKKNK